MSSVMSNAQVTSSESGAHDAQGTVAASSFWRDWIVVLTVASVLFILTANRGPQWQDSGQHMWRIISGDLVHRLGLALSHPLHYWLGRAALFPKLGEPAYAVTLVSALCAGVAIANVFGCGYALTRCRFAAMAAAASLALSHTFWQMATRTEVYTLTAALLAGECWLLIRFIECRRPSRLLLAMLLNGLGVANHLLALLTTPVLLVVLLVSLRKRTIGIHHVVLAAVVWLIASLPYTGLVWFQAVKTGSVSATIYSALFGRSFADNVLNVSMTLHGLGLVAAYFVLNFPNWVIPASIMGVVRARRTCVSPWALGTLLAGFVIHFLFAVRYNIVDQFTFFIPTYLFVAMIGSVGLAHLLRRYEGATVRYLKAAIVACLIATPMVYALTPAVAREFDLLEKMSRDKPYRDDYVYAFIPWSIADSSAGQMGRYAVELAGAQGLIIVEDGMAFPAVQYSVWRKGNDRVEATRDVLPEQMRAVARAGGNIVLVPARANDPRTPAPWGYWERTGDLYVLQGPNPQK